MSMKSIIRISLILSACAGATWAQSGWVSQTSGTTRNLNALSFRDTLVGWVAGDSGTLLKTTNGGANWMSRNAGTRSLRALHFTGPNTGWAVGDSGALLKTTDAGETWNALTSGTTRHLRAVHFRGNDSGWVGGDSGLLMRTVNGGTSWTRQPDSLLSRHTVNGITFTRSGAGFVSTGSGAYDGGVFRSPDRGATWTLVTGQAGYDYRAVVSAGDSVYYASGFLFPFMGNNVPVWSVVGMNDGGMNLKALKESFNAFSLYFSSPKTGWGVGINGSIARTTNGDTLIQQVSGTQVQLNAVYFANENVGWVAGNQGTILKSSTGGAVSVRQARLLPREEAFQVKGRLLSYALPRASRVRILVQNVDGTLVKSLQQGLQKAGAHTLLLSDLHISSGVYVLHFSDGLGTRQSKTLILP
jgi:photosystem II stability/assembly factor-like uncharacterized protein